MRKAGIPPSNLQFAKNCWYIPLCPHCTFWFLNVANWKDHHFEQVDHDKPTSQMGHGFHSYEGLINRIKNGINLRTTKIYKNHRINHLSTHQLVQDSMCQLYPHSWPHRCTEPLAETTPKAPSPRVKPTWALPSTEISPKIIKSWPEKNHNTEHCFDYHPGYIYIYIHTYIRIYTYIPYIYIYISDIFSSRKKVDQPKIGDVIIKIREENCLDWTGF